LVLVIDGMEGATGASPDVLLDHTGVPTLSALCEAVRSLEEMKALGEVQVIISGGIKNGVDAAKALALGADAVSIGTAALIALNCNAPLYLEDYEKLGVEPGYCHHCHTGRRPVGITTQGPELIQRLEIDEAADRVFDFLQSMTMDADARPRVWEERRPRPRSGGHAGAHTGVLPHHRDPSRGHRLRAHPRGDRRACCAAPVRGRGRSVT
jgi:glutamate synthase domain-containing protein 2